eukprot:66677_1
MQPLPPDEDEILVVSQANPPTAAVSLSIEQALPTPRLTPVKKNGSKRERSADQVKQLMIDQISVRNEVLRKKVESRLQELVDLGIDTTNWQSKIQPMASTNGTPSHDDTEHK